MADGGEVAPEFSSWLGAVAARLGAEEPGELRVLLEDHGCLCNESSVRAWLTGAEVPSLSKERTLINALNKALPDVDVWMEYGRWKEGFAPFSSEASRDQGQPERDLSQVVEESGILPPPLD